MALRPKHIYKRLNCARLDSSAITVRMPEILQVFREVRAEHETWMQGGTPARMAQASQHNSCAARISRCAHQATGFHHIAARTSSANMLAQ